MELNVERRGSDVLVSGLGDDFEGWSVTVADAGTVTIHPAPGHRLTQPKSRAIPFGAILAAAAEASAADRVDAASAATPSPAGVPDRVPGPSRDQLLRVAYRNALRYGVSPRGLIARQWQVPVQTAGKWITDLRERQVISTVHDERKSL